MLVSERIFVWREGRCWCWVEEGQILSCEWVAEELTLAGEGKVVVVSDAMRKVDNVKKDGVVSRELRRSGRRGSGEPARRGEWGLALSMPTKGGMCCA